MTVMYCDLSEMCSWDMQDHTIFIFGNSAQTHLARIPSFLTYVRSVMLVSMHSFALGLHRQWFHAHALGSINTVGLLQQGSFTRALGLCRPALVWNPDTF